MSAAAGTPAVVVLASLAAPLDPGLDELLGAEVADALRAALAARARRWAAAIAPDVAFEATTAGAASAALHGHEGPVLLASWDVPGLDAELGRLALEDLAHGTFVTVAPAMDGRPFLIGLPRVDHELFELVEGTDHNALFSRAAEHEHGMGMLRSERRLVSAADVRALAADPLAPADLLAALGGAVTTRADPGRS